MRGAVEIIIFKMIITCLAGDGKRVEKSNLEDGFAIVLGLSRARLGSSWGALRSSERFLNLPKRASRFMLEFSWAWFARLLLPKIAL